MTCNPDALAVLEAIGDYVLIKQSPRFPKYEAGEDLDVLVADRKLAIAALYEFHQKNTGADFDLKVTDTSGHCHVDFCRDEKLQLRIDLIDNFDFFSKFRVRPSFLTKIFSERATMHYGGRFVRVPSEIDDLTLRYFEYLEYFAEFPDKARHLDYVCAVRDPETKRKFFENTHRYIETRPKHAPEKPLPAVALEKGNQESVIYEGRKHALREIAWALRYIWKETLRDASSRTGRGANAHWPPPGGAETKKARSPGH